MKLTKLDEIVARVEASMCMTYGSQHPNGREEACISADDWRELIAMLRSPPEPVVSAVERILDEESAWISRPSSEVTRRIALAATIAAYASLSSEVTIQ